MSHIWWFWPSGATAINGADQSSRTAGIPYRLASHAAKCARRGPTRHSARGTAQRVHETLESSLFVPIIGEGSTEALGWSIRRVHTSHFVAVLSLFRRCYSAVLPRLFHGKP